MHSCPTPKGTQQRSRVRLTPGTAACGGSAPVTRVRWGTPPMASGATTRSQTAVSSDHWTQQQHTQDGLPVHAALCRDCCPAAPSVCAGASTARSVSSRLEQPRACSYSRCACVCVCVCVVMCAALPAVVPAGSYMQFPTIVSLCPAGQWKGSVGADEGCTSCADGVTTPAAGATSAANCTCEWGALQQVPACWRPGAACTHPMTGSLRWPVVPPNSQHTAAHCHWASCSRGPGWLTDARLSADWRLCLCSVAGWVLCSSHQQQRGHHACTALPSEVGMPRRQADPRLQHRSSG